MPALMAGIMLAIRSCHARSMSAVQASPTPSRNVPTMMSNMSKIMARSTFQTS